MFFKDNLNPNFCPGESLCASDGLWGGGLHWGGQHLQEDLQTQVSTISFLKEGGFHGTRARCTYKRRQQCRRVWMGGVPQTICSWHVYGWLFQFSLQSHLTFVFVSLGVHSGRPAPLCRWLLASRASAPPYTTAQSAHHHHHQHHHHQYLQQPHHRHLYLGLPHLRMLQQLLHRSHHQVVINWRFPPLSIF